jgi:hypothetical protein
MPWRDDIITALVTLSLILFSTGLLPAQTKDGFKGFGWGTDFSAMQRPLGLKLKDKSNSLASYFTNARVLQGSATPGMVSDDLVS